MYGHGLLHMFRTDSRCKGLEHGSLTQKLRSPEDRGQNGGNVELREVAVRDCQGGSVVKSAGGWGGVRGRRGRGLRGLRVGRRSCTSAIRNEA